MTPGRPGWGGLMVMMTLVACTSSPVTGSIVTGSPVTGSTVPGSTVTGSSFETGSPSTAPRSTAPATETQADTTTTPMPPVPAGYRSVTLPQIGATLAIPSSWVTREMRDGDLDDAIGRLNPANQQLIALLEGASAQGAETYLIMAFEPSASGYSDNVNVSLTPAPNQGTDLLTPTVSLIEAAGGTIVATSGDPERTATIRYSLAVAHADGATFEVHAISHVVATDLGLLTVTVASGTAAGLDEVGPQIIESLAWQGA